MSGLEGVAAGAAAKVTGEAVKAGAELVKVDREVRKAERLALLEEVKNSQGFRDAAAVRGKRMAVREQMGLALFSPLARMFRIRQDYFEADFAKDFAEKVADVPEENLQAPKPSIAAPAMEGLGYALEEPELKNMYLELLARAADDRQASSAHPSFAEVIRQLTAEEALLLRTFEMTRGKLHPMVRLKIQVPNELGSKTIMSNVVRYDDPITGSPAYNDQLPMYLDNWQRLGLVQHDYATKITAPGEYDWVEERPEKAAVTKVAESNGSSAVIEEGVFAVTSFGAQFAKAVGITA